MLSWSSPAVWFFPIRSHALWAASCYSSPHSHKQYSLHPLTSKELHSKCNFPQVKTFKKKVSFTFSAPVTVLSHLWIRAQSFTTDFHTVNMKHLPHVHVPRKSVAPCMITRYCTPLVDSAPPAMSLNIPRHNEEQQGKQYRYLQAMSLPS